MDDGSSLSLKSDAASDRNVYGSLKKLLHHSMNYMLFKLNTTSLYGHDGWRQRQGRLLFISGPSLVRFKRTRQTMLARLHTSSSSVDMYAPLRLLQGSQDESR